MKDKLNSPIMRAITLAIAVGSAVAYLHTNFAPKRQVDAMNGMLGELHLNMRLMVQRTGAKWVEVK